MRKITLGLLILGAGMLLSLPFRRSTAPELIPESSLPGQSDARLFDDESIQMLVKEVTQDVEIPTVYQAQTDYAPPPDLRKRPPLPLTYEDLAVPVDEDPIYQRRFNAVAGNQFAAGRPATRSVDHGQHLANLERRFSETPLDQGSITGLDGMSSPPEAIAGSDKRWTFTNPIAGSAAQRGSSQPGTSLTGGLGAQFASSGSSERKSVLAEPNEKSVLAPLPPPSDADADSETERAKHWIRQPE